LKTYILEFFANNQNFFLILIVILVTRFKDYTSGNIFGIWIANLLGTFFHELAHLSVSALMLGKPTKVSLFPSKQENGKYILGYVESSNVKWYNAFPISMAPLLLLALAFYFNKYYFEYIEENIYTYIVYIFVTVTLLENAIPSMQDFKVGFSNLGFLIYLAIPILYFYKGYLL